MRRVVVVLIYIFALCVALTRACTTIAVDPKATTDRCSYTTTTDDCKDCDFRLAYVPSRRYAAGSNRPVYEVRFQYPHVVSDRSRTWKASNLQGSKMQLRAWGTETKPMGYIPQVSHTYALIESGSSYALINENSVSVGESTCPAVFASKPISDGGKALLDVSELSKIALERSRTAREAIQIMGKLAEKYGYYGAEWDLDTKFLEAGETLTVSDPSEAWVFHILPDDSGSSAIWAAQRIPDGHITVIANFFIIRGLVTNGIEKNNYMYSRNVHSIARKHNLLKVDSLGQLDFSATFGLPRPHSSYTTLRRWRVLTLANPALAAVLNSTTESDLPQDFPFSTKVTVPLNSDTLVSMQRDHFEGTVYDLTIGEAAGAFNDPDRYDTEVVDGMSEERAKSGEFARGISLFRTSYAAVSRGCASLPLSVSAMTRVASQQPDASSFVPLYVGAGELPRALTRGSLFRVDRDAYFWRVALVSNWAHRYYSHAIPVVQRVQNALEKAADYRVIDAVASKLVQAGRDGDAASYLRTRMASAVEAAHREYGALFWRLVAMLHDGYKMSNADAETITMTSFFYPEKWLERVGYFAARETSVEKGREALRRAQARLVGKIQGNKPVVTHSHSGPRTRSEVFVGKPLSSVPYAEAVTFPRYGFWRGALFGFALCAASLLMVRTVRKGRYEQYQNIA